VLTGNLSLNANLAGIQLSGNLSVVDSGQIGEEVSLAAGLAGTLSTRTSNTAGVATLGTGHGLLENDVVDVYWSGGVRYGVAVGSVGTNTVPFSGGAGTNLPTQASALVVCKQTVVDVDVSGDAISLILCSAQNAVHLDFQQSDGTSIKALSLGAGALWFWSDGYGDNPFASAAVAKVAVSNGDSANATVLRVGLLYDSLA
jgi:hypothetical protein